MFDAISMSANLVSPWATLYDNSVPLQVGVVFLHLTGLLVAGGLALAADRGVLRGNRLGWRERLDYVREVGAAHNAVMAGLAVVVVTGLLLLASDIEFLLPSPVFWLKMGVFALLLVNGLSLQRAERGVLDGAARMLETEPAVDARPEPDGRLERQWRTLRLASIRSASLWLIVLFLGTLVPVAA